MYTIPRVSTLDIYVYFIYIYWFEVILMNVVFVGKDQGQRPSRKEKGGAAETAG